MNPTAEHCQAISATLLPCPPESPALVGAPLDLHPRLSHRYYGLLWVVRICRQYLHHPCSAPLPDISCFRFHLETKVLHTPDEEPAPITQSELWSLSSSDPTWSLPLKHLLHPVIVLAGPTRYLDLSAPSIRPFAVSPPLWSRICCGDTASGLGLDTVQQS